MAKRARSFSSRYVKRQKPTRTLRDFWHSLQKPRDAFLVPFGHKNAVVLLTILIIGIGAYAIDQSWKAATGISPIPIFDPTIETKLWEPGAVGDLSEWNVLNGAYAAGAGLGNCGGSMGAGSQCIRLTNNSTFPGIAITKSSSDLSPVSGKAMALFYEWGLGTGYGLNKISGMYLTRNGTLPLEANYSPMNDPNVALMYRVYASSATIWQTYFFVQRDPTQTLGEGDTGGCGPSGTCLTGETIDEAVTNDPSIGTIWQMAVMNFTGYTATTGICSLTAAAYGISSPQGCSFLDKDGGRTWPPLNPVTQLPGFQFQAQPYYVGFFVEAGSTINTYTFALNTAQVAPVTGLSSTPKITISTFTPAQATPPNIDTGGFFGPVLRWFLNGAVWILNGIAQFLGFVADVFITAMNAVGSFFGLGAIGTAIRDALVGVSTWVSSVFGSIFAQAANIANGFKDLLELIVQLGSTFWTRITSLANEITSFFGFFWTVWDVFFPTANFSAKVILFFWWIMGMVMTLAKGIPGFRNWSWLTLTVGLAIAKGLIWIGKEAFELLLNVKRLLAQWI